MATPRWVGAALAVAQTSTITVANTWATADLANVTIGTRTLTLTVGTDTTTAQVATALKEMINGDDQTGTGNHTFSETGNNVPEFQEVTATVSGSVVTLIGNTKGVPFTLSASETTAGSGTATAATATAATGPNHVDNTDNWSTGSLPADSDVVYLDNSDVSLLYGMDQSAIEPAAMYIDQSFTGSIGLPATNENGYPEYREQYLKIGPAILQIGRGGGNGSGRLKIDSTSDQVALTVFNTGSSADDLPALIWKGTHASNTLTILNGSVGVAVFGAETATLATWTASGGELLLGAGVTLSGALTNSGGTVTVNSLIDGSLTQASGSTVINGTGNVDQLTLRGGTVVLNTTGSLGGATVVSGDGVLDLSQSPIALAGVSAAIDLYGTECRILDPFKRLGNAAFDFNEGASASQVDFGSGTNYRLTRGAVA